MPDLNQVLYTYHVGDLEGTAVTLNDSLIKEENLYYSTIKSYPYIKITDSYIITNEVNNFFAEAYNFD